VNIRARKKTLMPRYYDERRHATTREDAAEATRILRSDGEECCLREMANGSDVCMHQTTSTTTGTTSSAERRRKGDTYLLLHEHGIAPQHVVSEPEEVPRDVVIVVE
jgi:hypothetical protein